jgi:hypothetical protein
MTKAEALAIFQEYIDDTAITSETYLKQSLFYLNNFFGRRVITTDTETVIDEYSVTTPSNVKRIEKIELNDVEIKKLSNKEDKNKLINTGVQRWENKGGDIYFLQAFSETGLTVKIDAIYKFIWADTGDLDIEDELQDLLFLGATMRYFQTLLSKTMTNREDNPDTTPTEIRRTIKELRDEYESRIKLAIKGRTHE